jgi:hypothetical protein
MTDRFVILAAILGWLVLGFAVLIGVAVVTFLVLMSMGDR